MCGQSHDYVRKAHPLYARKTLTFRVFAGRPVIQSSSKLNGCTSQPIENQTSQAPFWKNWCAKSVSGVGLCEASALRPEQIGKLWFLGNSLSLFLATGTPATAKISSWELTNVPKISKDIQKCFGACWRHKTCECKPYTVPFWLLCKHHPFGSCSKQQPTATKAQQNQVDSFRLFVLLQATASSQTVTLSLVLSSSVLCGSVIWSIIFRLV